MRRKFWTVMGTLAVALVPWTASFAQEAGKTKFAPAVEGAAASASATVTKIDKEKRKLTLKNDQGEDMDISVPTEVRNFDQIKKGDRVTVAYKVEVAISVRKPGEPAPAVGERDSIERSQPGQKPGGTATTETTISAEVLAVDLENHTLKLKDHEGKTHTVEVKDPERQKRLTEIKKGDTLDVTYTEALAISVEPQPKKPAK